MIAQYEFVYFGIGFIAGTYPEEQSGGHLGCHFRLQIRDSPEWRGCAGYTRSRLEPEIYEIRSYLEEPERAQYLQGNRYIHGENGKRQGM